MNAGFKRLCPLLLTALASCAMPGKPGAPAERAEAPPANQEIQSFAGVVSQDPEPALDREKLGESASRGSVAPKYRPLADAVRSGRPGAINDEAAKLLAVNPNDLMALNTLALVNLRRGKLGVAKIFINRAFETKPPNSSMAALHNNLAVIFLEEGDQIAAVAELKKALQFDSRHPEAMGNLGAIYAMGGDYARARPLLERAYRATKSNLAVANSYAISLRAAKDFQGAKRIYDEAMKHNSRDVALLLNYSILLIEFMNKPKDGMDLLYRVKFIETERKDVLAKVNALEKKAKSELK
jgi:tetratricopeptide (TPR) repeat protein